MCLNDDTAKLLNIRSLARLVLLVRLNRNRAVLAIASVDLQALLVALKAHLDTSLRRPHAQDLQARVVWLAVPGPVEDESVVVALAAGSARVHERGDVLADHLVGLREVVGGAVGDVDAASGDQDAVDVDDAVGVGHVKRVVEDRDGFGVDEGAQVPVDVVGKHDGRGVVDGNGDQTADEGRVVRERVGGDVEDVTWEAGLRVVVEGEGDAVAGHAGDGPVLLVVADEATVQGVNAAVFVLWNMRGHAVDFERAILDSGHDRQLQHLRPEALGHSPVRVATDDGAEVGVVRLSIRQVLGRVVVANNDVLVSAILILNIHVRNAGSIWDEGRVDPLRTQSVLLEWVA